MQIMYTQNGKRQFFGTWLNHTGDEDHLLLWSQSTSVHFILELSGQSSLSNSIRYGGIRSLG